MLTPISICSHMEGCCAYRVLDSSFKHSEPGNTSPSLSMLLLSEALLNSFRHFSLKLNLWILRKKSKMPILILPKSLGMSDFGEKELLQDVTRHEATKGKRPQRESNKILHISQTIMCSHRFSSHCPPTPHLYTAF